MTDGNADPKQAAILQAAWTAFATYGYRKTSMDDIARGAGMSRPALYLHYRNKEDIFRSLGQAYYAEAEVKVRAALAQDAPVADQLAAGFEAQGAEIARAILGSAHGLELLDTKSTVAPDVTQAGEARMADVYAGWLTGQAAAGRVRLEQPAETIAVTMTTALHGIKSAAPDFETYQRRVLALARLLGRGLAV